MATYSIDDGFSQQITTGLQEYEAHKVAQRIANERGETVYLYSSWRDENGEWQSSEYEAFAPDVDDAHEDAADDSLAYLAEGRLRHAEGILSGLGYDARWSDDSLVVAVPDERDEYGEPTSSYAEDTLRTFRKALGSGYRAEWTGDGDTDGSTGQTTSDVAISWEG